MIDDSMVTSKDIIRKTGISRATLNNYIKVGILPRPVVGSPRSGQSGARQIGYFPPEALERVYRVRLLKSEGRSMEEISRFFSGELSDTDAAGGVRGEGRAGFSQKSDEKQAAGGNLQVTICDIQSPAYLVNHNFEVEWINTQAEELIFQRSVRSCVDIESRNIFRLFLGEKDRRDAQDWRELVSVHLTVLQGALDEARLSSLYRGITPAESELLVDLFRACRPGSSEMFYHLPFSLAGQKGAGRTYWVHTMTFREGTFFVFVPDDAINSELLSMLEQREKIISELLRRRVPSLVSLCVLVANLQSSVKISAELLPAQYFDLINGLWEQVGPAFEKHNGIYGKHVGDGMLYYFLDKPGEDYIMNCINCAIELRERMRRFSSIWKGIKGWANDLFLNIGLNEGQEFFGTIHSANTIEFTALGDSINIAARLSEFARNGEIWTTKNLISKLSCEERSSFHFGVHYRDNTRETFIRDSFSRVCDLLNSETPHHHRLSAIAGLPIAEIREKIIPSSN
jgi:class 3 adenylate cyclase/DNA-binding transcriptional MerR regulator